MSRPKLLDLYCGAGGAARGYQMAGFEVVGVDIQMTLDYCGETFICGDALDALDDATTERVLDHVLREAPDLHRRLLREASQIAPDAVNDALRAEGVTS